MASEYPVADQSISELTGVKKLGDDTKEEEKHEPDDVSVADEINKEEEHKQVSSSSESALETNEGKPNDVEIFTSKEPVNSAFKQEDLKAAEVTQTSENGIKSESSNDKAEIELVESEDSKDDVLELVHTEVPNVVFLDASEVPEEIDVDRSTLTSVSVPVKTLEAESGSPEGHKSEESAETKPGLELIKSISAVDSEAPKENNADLITPTAIEVPLKDPESSSVSLEEKKPEEHGETKEHVELSRSEDCKEEVHELVPTEVYINGEASEKSDVYSSARAIVEVPVKDFEVVSSSPEEQKAEVGAESEVKELIKSGYSKEEGQELVSEEVPTDISEEVKKNDVHLSVPTSTEVPLKDLEVESGSPEEQKLEEGVETKFNIALIESGESKEEGQDFVSGQVPMNTSEAPEENDVDFSAPTSTVVPVKNLEVESSSPGEQKPEEGAETQVNIKLIESGDSKVEGQELVSASTSEEHEGNNTDLSTPTGIEVPVKDLEVVSGSPEEQKIEESAESKVDTDFIKSGESKDEGQASSEVPTGSSQAPEINDVDLSIPTSTEVPVKDLEAESGSPDEQKPEEGAETKVNIKLIESGDSKVEGQESVPAEVPASTSEEREDNNTDLSTQTGIEVPVKDLEVESGSPEEQKIEESAETKANTDFIKSGESKDEGKASGEVPTSSSQAPEINDIDLSIPTSTEVPVKDLEVESSSPEEQKPEEGAETKVNIKLIESGDSKVEGQESVSAEVPASTSGEHEGNNTDLSTPTGIEVPVKDLEVESGSPEEQKIEESAETKANTDFIKPGESKDEGKASGEVPTSSSQAPGINDVDLSIPTSTEVPVKDLEVESSYPEEQKPEVGAETKVNIKLIESGASKVAGQESVSADIPASTSEECEDNNTDLSTPTGIEVPVKDLEVEFGSPEEQKIEESADTKVNTDFFKSGESKDEGQASGEVPTSSSQAPGINDVDLSIPTSTEVPVKDLEDESSSPEEQKPEVGAETKVNIKLIESGDSKVEGQESVSAAVPASPSEEREENNADLSTTVIEVPVKDLEVEFGYPEEKKFEGSAEIKVNTDFIKSGESKDEGQDLVSGDVPTNTSEAPEINAADLSAPTSTEVPAKDLEVESGSPEEQKSEVNIELMKSDDKKSQELVSAEVPDNTSNAPEKEDVEFSTPTSMEVPLKDLEVKSGSPEEHKLEESAKTNIDIESLKLGDSKEVQESVFTEVSINGFEEYEHNNVDLTSLTSTEVPVKDLEVEFGSAEEQNPKESVETKEPSSDATTIDGGGEVAGSSSYEDKSSGVGELVDKEDGGLKEEVIQTRMEEDQTPSDEDKVSEAIAVKKDDEFLEDGIEGSTVLDVVPPVTEVFPDKVLEERKDESSEVDNTDTAPKVSEVSLAGGNVLEEDVNIEAIERDLAETSIDSTAGGVSTGQAKIPENVEVEPLELKFEELNVSSETSEVPSVGERVSAVDEKSETSKGEKRRDETSEVDNIDTAQNVSEVSSAVGNFLEKDVNVEAIERDLAETAINSTVDALSTEQAKIPENVEVKPLECKFEELNPEASQVPSAGERVSSCDEKSESSKGETGATLVKTPSFAHLVEETENESSKSEAEASVEQFPEAVKEIIASESYNAKKDKTSRDVSLEEKNANVNQDKKSEVKVDGVIENAPDHEELGIEKREGEKPKDEEPILSSDTRHVKLIKEGAKRDSNIFAKVKRSIIKAKKAILGKSPGPKTVSSESKDENI